MIEVYIINKLKFRLQTCQYFASRARATTADTKGVAAEVPVKSSVQSSFVSIVGYKERIIH